MESVENQEVKRSENKKTKIVAVCQGSATCLLSLVILAIHIFVEGRKKEIMSWVVSGTVTLS